MRSIYGAIFEAAHPADELNRLEARAAAPDFWKDQAEAQRVLQRRRRLEQDRELAASLRKRTDDLGVLFEWAAAGEAVGWVAGVMARVGAGAGRTCLTPVDTFIRTQATAATIATNATPARIQLAPDFRERGPSLSLGGATGRGRSETG